MPPLDAATYLTHLRSESARFREVLADCDPSAPVPSCPDWDAGDLLWHLVTVHWFWTTAVVDRPAEVDESREPDRPATYREALELHDRWSRALGDALDGVEPSDRAWTWSGDPADHTVGFILRRQAHEALVHRLDAELAVGVHSDVDARLAADGVHEVLDVMYGGCPPWGTWEPGDTWGRVDCTDTGDEVWLRLGRFTGTHPRTGDELDEVDFHVVEAPAGTEPAFVVDGPAAALDAWLWHRTDDSAVSATGDRAALDQFHAVVRHPID